MNAIHRAAAPPPGRPLASIGALAVLVASGMALLAPAYAQAQGDGELLQPASPAPGDPFAVCATEAYLPGGGTETSCDVVEALDLGTPVESWLLRYRRVAEVPEGGAVAVVDGEEFAVIEASGSGYRVVWRNPVDTRFHTLEMDVVAPVGDATIVSYAVCLRGTGGCTPQFLIRDGAGWGIVDQAYLGDLAALAPEGWSLHKGRGVDLRSLAGVQPLLGPDDANCCPSGEIRFALGLQGRALVLEDASVSVPEPEPADSTAGDPPPDGAAGGAGTGVPATAELLATPVP